MPYYLVERIISKIDFFSDYVKIIVSAKADFVLNRLNKLPLPLFVKEGSDEYVRAF